ncbi:MAG: PDZ domain-containing protein [Acidimicrobiia bacterium]|nr:PDZ domain-containing protein [Acidimicrobiia bacterium]
MAESERPGYLISALFAVGFLAVALWNVEIGYQASIAYPAVDAADAIVVDGGEVYPPSGELLMLSVIHQDVNVFEALLAVADPKVDLIEKTKLRRSGESDQEYQSRVLEQMTDSNFKSIVVALTYLGYPTRLVVTEIIEGVPADGVLELGDVIIAADGAEMKTVADLQAAVSSLAIGDTIEMTVEREGEEVTLTIELTEHVSRAGDPMIGIGLGELPDPPFSIDIDSTGFGGPSAGLMHTLAIIDTLTEGELTAGRIIAGTGTIDFDGKVGLIGSVRQKVVGAEASGAEYILVPAGQYETALTAPRETIEIIPVETLQDAIDFLESLATS